MRVVREPTSAQMGWSEDRVRMGHPECSSPAPRPSLPLTGMSEGSHGHMALTTVCGMVSRHCWWNPQKRNKIRCRRATLLHSEGAQGVNYRHRTWDRERKAPTASMTRYKMTLCAFIHVSSALLRLCFKPSASEVFLPLMWWGSLENQTFGRSLFVKSDTEACSWQCPRFVLLP